MFSGALTEMIPSHKMLWLDCVVRRPASFGSSGDKTLTLAVKINAWGERKGSKKRLATDRRDFHRVRCKGGERWCRPVPLFAQHAILYDAYDVRAAVVRPADTYPDAEITTKMELHFVNREYTSFGYGRTKDIPYKHFTQRGIFSLK